MKSIIAFGNPLLDITIPSKDHSLKLVHKYNLKMDGQKEISLEEMKALSKDIEGLDKHISPGGCSQNSLRVLQWVLKRKCDASIFGSVGKDSEAEILRSTLEKEGVQTKYIVQDNLPTGKTVALVTGLTRSLVAHIGAAEVLSLESMLAYQNFSSSFEASDIILIEAYFLTNRFDTVKHLVNLSEKHDNKLLVFNLCGDYIFKVVPGPIKYLVKYANIIFGNKVEFLALASLLNFNSLDDMATSLTRSSETNKTKSLVITNGPHPVTCYTEQKTIELIPPVLDEREIKDTTAAGDAFIGGFLAALIMSKDIKKCINSGFYAASNIIKQNGCSLPIFESEVSL